MTSSTSFRVAHATDKSPIVSRIRQRHSRKYAVNITVLRFADETRKNHPNQSQPTATVDRKNSRYVQRPSDLTSFRPVKLSWTPGTCPYNRLTCKIKSFLLCTRLNRSTGCPKRLACQKLCGCPNLSGKSRSLC